MAPIGGAEVRVPAFFDRTVTTTEFGKCAITLPGGTYEILASAAMYDDASASVVVTNDNVIPLEIAGASANPTPGLSNQVTAADANASRGGCIHHLVRLGAA